MHLSKPVRTARTRNSVRASPAHFYERQRRKAASWYSATTHFIPTASLSTTTASDHKICTPRSSLFCAQTKYRSLPSGVSRVLRCTYQTCEREGMQSWYFHRRRFHGRHAARFRRRREAFFSSINYIHVAFGSQLSKITTAYCVAESVFLFFLHM